MLTFSTQNAKLMANALPCQTGNGRRVASALITRKAYVATIEALRLCILKPNKICQFDWCQISLSIYATPRRLF